ncbi:MAG: methyltransferase domain-containing protein [Candidatus Pacearchaeota archaeon]
MNKKLLNIGCGTDIRKGYINLDIVKLPGVDVVWDIEKFPYPFKDNTFDEIFCSHVLEHVSDLVKVMEEIWRISKPHARIKIIVPNFSGYYAFVDPTHKRFFTYSTFDYFTGAGLGKYYTKARFRIIKKRIEDDKYFKGLNFLVNLFPKFYTRFLAFILPMTLLKFELETIK